jgi:hypothetical protein
VCGSFQDLGLLLGSELLNKWFLLSKLKSSLRKFNHYTTDAAQNEHDKRTNNGLQNTTQKNKDEAT